MRTSHPHCKPALLLALCAALAAACSDGGDAPTPAAADDASADATADAAADATPDVAPDTPEDTGPPAPVVVALFDDARITSDPSAENFQKVRAGFEVPTGPWASATLVVDLRSTCYPFEQWRDDPPPAGHNWPASCDAFDRNFEFIMDEPTADGQPPGLEVVRAITPFGGPLHLEVDMTDLANAQPGAHQMKAQISTWGDGSGRVSGANGGWNVSARLELVAGPAPPIPIAVLPLFDGSVGDTATWEPLRFELPEGTVRAKVEYRTTGHGGARDTSCIGPAEEFCERTHRLTADGASLASVVPWRDDCESLCTLEQGGPFGSTLEYCKENPCGAISSVRAPRANWCPGSITPPMTLEPSRWNTPGPHEFRFQVYGIKPGGSWRTSVVVFAYAE